MPMSAKICKRHKYGVSAKDDRTVDGIVFDSKKEAKRYGELMLMVKAGVIANLQRQVRYDWKTTLSADNGNSVIRKNHYKADFVYDDLENGRQVVEDVKGYRTADYNRKKDIILKLYGINITEV